MSNTLKTISFFLLAVLHSCLLKPEIDKETYYIPDGFTGKVLVLFNCKDGKPKEWTDNGRRLYRIPESGVLKTQFKPNTGVRYFSEKPKDKILDLRSYFKFYYTSNNTKKELNYAYLYIPRFHTFFKPNEVNITGASGTFGFGVQNENYQAVINYVFNGIDSNYTNKSISYTGSSITKNDWYRIENWNTFNAIKDTIPLLKPQKNK